MDIGIHLAPPLGFVAAADYEEIRDRISNNLNEDGDRTFAHEHHLPIPS
jgi:hypothetical protein